MQTVILLIGLLIYASYGIYGFLYLLAAVFLTWITGILLPRYRWIYFPGILVSIIPLLFMRISALTEWNILIPLGVSYFTLQIISYLTDIRRGKYEPDRNLLHVALYLTYLPHLFFGPIERFDTMQAALNERKITWDSFSEGAIRAIWGLFKKLAIAARAAVVVQTISSDSQAYCGAYVFLAVLLYSIELYADFSGGMDIVLGISRMLGLRMSENFETPYFSQTIQEFWRRWHITLGAWLKDYVYIPLGGNRKGKACKVLFTLITFLVSGIWHGVHYMVWGILHGILTATGKLFKTPWKAVNCIITFLLVSLLWVFFIWEDTAAAISSLASIFTTFNYADLVMNAADLGLVRGEWIVFTVSALILWGYDLNQKRINEGIHAAGPATRIAVMGGLILVVLMFGMYGIGFEASEFIYSNF